MTDDKLKSIVSRVERLMDERDGLAADIRDIYAEAKGHGYVPKILRKVIQRRRMDPDRRAEEDSFQELYEAALDAPTRRVVELAKQGKSAREIEAETGVDHVTVSRAVSL